MRLSTILAGLLLASCSPSVQSYTPSDTKPTLASGHFTAADNAVLSTRSWLPKHKPIAIIIALHGFNDYSHAFEDSGQFFARHGIAVFAYDQRGFGASPQPGIWPGEENLTTDLRDYARQVTLRYPGVPLYLLGESMGGAVTTAALAMPDFPPVRGMILESPALWGGETMNPLYRSVLWTVAHTMPEHQFTGSDLKILASNNIPMLRALGLDPLVLKKTRSDTIYGMVELMDSAYAKEPEIHTPVLLLYGACDEVIPRTPIHAASKRFGGDVTFAYYPNGYHMLLRDLQSEQVMEDILSWMRNPAAPLPSGYGPADTKSMKSLDRDACSILLHGPGGSRRLG